MSLIRNALVRLALLALTLVFGVVGVAGPASAGRDGPPEAPRGVVEALGR